MFSTSFFAKCLCVGYDGPWASVSYCVTKTCLYNFDPLKPHFYIVKLGFTGVYIIFLISAKKTQIVCTH